MSLGQFALTALVVSLLPEHHAARGASLDGNLFKLHHIPERVLRGDWQTPQALLMTYERTWRDALADVLRATAESDVQAILVVPESEKLETVEEWLRDLGLEERVAQIVVAPLDSAWIRDYGPLQTIEPGGHPVWLDASYPSRPADDDLPQTLAERMQVSVEALPEQWDGGAVISNGAGLCATTEEAFDSVGVPRSGIAAISVMLEQMGCRVLTLLPALSRDPTKHADMFAQFTAVDRVLLAEVDAERSPQDARRMEQAARRLRRAAKVLELSLTIDRVPLPVGDDYTYFSYVNGQSLGGLFLVPQYSDVAPLHEAAIYSAMSRALPGKRLVPVLADTIIPLHGALHCILLGVDLPGTNNFAAANVQPPIMRGLIPNLVPAGTGPSAPASLADGSASVKTFGARRSRPSFKPRLRPRGTKPSRTTTKIP